MRAREALQSFDWILTGTAVLLVLLGLAMLLSTTSDDSIVSGLVIRQLGALAVAAVVYATISLFPYHRLRRYALVLFMIGLVALITLAQLGPIIRGTSSRVELFSGVQVQPSEFVKIALVLVLAWFFAKRPPTLLTVLASGGIAGAATILVAIEPDVGEAALMASLWIGMSIYLGTSWRALFGLGVAGIGVLIGAWRWFFADYQKARIITFLDPTADPLGAGYNVTQSLVAFGSGGFFGRGLGHGPQSQLNFLPERHTDFILASIGEELGFVGVVLLIGLYSVLLWRIKRISQQTSDTFGQLLAAGVFLLLLVSFFVSAGMNMGILPVTGIPLPLVSYGGSNLVATLALIGLVQSVNIYSTFKRSAPSELTHFS